MDFEQYIAGLSDEELQQYLQALMQGGALKERSQIVKEQMKMAQEMGRPSQEKGYGLGGGLMAGLGNAIRGYQSGQEMGRLRQEQQGIVKEQTSMREQQTRQYAEMLRRKQAEKQAWTQAQNVSVEPAQELPEQLSEEQVPFYLRRPGY